MQHTDDMKKKGNLKLKSWKKEGAAGLALLGLYFGSYP